MGWFVGLWVVGGLLGQLVGGLVYFVVGWSVGELVF